MEVQTTLANSEDLDVKIKSAIFKSIYAMKTKIILLAILVTMISFTVATTQSNRQPKVALKKSVHAETRMNKGFAMEDKDQFN